MGKSKVPSTPALRLLKTKGVDYVLHTYTYEARGGTKVSSRELGVDEHAVIKTLIFEDEHRKPVVVLMHGDLEVSGKALARFLGVKSIAPAKPEVAEKHSGYRVGGTSPFGLKKPLPVYVEETIFALPKIWINAGQRGLLVEIEPACLENLLQVTRVCVAQGVR